MTDRELDALVAEHVMGYNLCECDEDKLRLDWQKKKEEYLKDSFQDYGFYNNFIRFNSNNECNFCGLKYLYKIRYSTDIATAWEVVEKMYNKKFVFTLKQRFCGKWECDFGYKQSDFYESEKQEAETAPTVICLAALKAKGIEVS